MPIVYSQNDLRGLLTAKGQAARAIDAVERGLAERHQGEAGHAFFVDLPLEDDANVVKVFGVSAPDAATVRAFPGEPNKTARTDAAYYLVLDPVTGALEAILAGDDLNALRTSVPAGLGARHLAPSGASVLGVLGSSEQARGCAWSIAGGLPALGEIVVWSPTEENRERFAKEQSSRLGLPVRACDSAEEVVTAADVFVAAGRTPGSEAAYDAAWVKPGALAISLTMSAPPELVARSRYVVPTENRPKVVAFGFAKPAWSGAPPTVEGAVALADVIAGKVPARDSDDQTVLFELANMYTWDHALASWALEWARENATGTEFALTVGEGK